MLAFALFLALLLVIHVAMRRFKSGPSASAKAKVCSEWLRIEKEQDVKHAVLNADKLLDYALAQHGYVGSLGEKLKKAGPLFSDLNGIWRAHKVRNGVAHEIDFRLDASTHQHCMRVFRQALKDLDYL